jgi:hypothetical protein
MRARKLGLLILLVAPLGAIARPQQNASSGQQDSLADAARRAQAQKKNQPQASKVWDNDNIPTTNDTISVIGQGESSSPSAPPPPAQNTVTPEQKAAVLADLNLAKAQLESLKTDLDIAQRKYALDEQTYLSDPNWVKSGSHALDEEKDEIAAKQQQVVQAQKKVDDLQAQLDAATK